MFQENTEWAREPSIPLREGTVWVQTGLNELLLDGYISCIQIIGYMARIAVIAKRVTVLEIKS